MQRSIYGQEIRAARGVPPEGGRGTTTRARIAKLAGIGEDALKAVESGQTQRPTDETAARLYLALHQETGADEHDIPHLALAYARWMLDPHARGVDPARRALHATRGALLPGDVTAASAAEAVAAAADEWLAAQRRTDQPSPRIVRGPGDAQG